MFPVSLVELHSAFTHVPVAFLLAVPIFEVGALALRKPEWRIVSFWLLAGTVVMARPSLLTGWFTGDDLKFTGTGAAPPLLFVRHRLAAFSTAGLALVLLFWRVKARDQLPRPAQIAAIVLALVTAGVVAYTGYLGGKMVFGETRSESDQPSDYVAVPPTGTPATSAATTKTPTVDAKLVATGQKLFKDLPCLSCHSMDGKGAHAGPDLTHEARRHADINWQIQHLKDPQKVKPNSDMPPYDYLPPAQLKALAAYLVTRK